MFKRLFSVFFLLVLVAGTVVAVDGARFFLQPLSNGTGKIVRVDPGMSFNAIAQRLVKTGVLVNRRDARYLSAYARITGVAGRVKSGEYVVPTHQTPAHVLDLLVSGKTRQYKLTLIEGWRFADIRSALDNNEALDRQLTGKSDQQVMAAIGHSEEKPEGRFMPDTYLFTRGMTDVAFLKRAHDAMARFLKQAWSKRADDAVVKTPYQALILASIVEKETAVPSERARIAGVFSRRLQKGMRLQTDPTVIYGIENYDGNIRRSDLRKDTPYNTYTRVGLPPTPIAMPSRASIRAALHPKAGTALYFVARGDGSHVFSDTLAQHNKAVNKYQSGS